MEKIFKSQIKKATTLTSDSEKLQHLTSTLRSLLQTVSVSCLEAVLKLTPYTECDIDIHYISSRILQPTDGMPVEIIDNLTPILRSYVCRDFLSGWFEKTDETNSPLNKSINEWVEFRNKRPGHGVLDKDSTEIWSEKIQSIINDCLIILSDAIPIINSSTNTIALGGRAESVEISTPLIHNNRAIVISRITAKKGIWKLQGQTLCWEKSDQFTTDLPNDNIFINQETLKSSKFEFTEIQFNNFKSSLFENIPTRQTDVFEGRTKELEQLKDWLGDYDSKACLIYGDGGVGKTTLVLEFLNNLLEGNIEPKPPIPEIISYYTAKMTRWTDQGITHFKGVSSAVENCIRELMHCIYPVLDKDWYKTNGSSLIDKIESTLVEQGYSRDDILLIIDNTETLATSPEEIEALAEFLRKVTKKIGRTLLTSRRRELLETRPIQISALSEEEAIRLIDRLAKEYSATPLIQCGEARLRRVSRLLSCKPLLIDTLARYISRTSASIDDALDQVLRQPSDQLLEFLYEDAWLRMNEAQRKVFMLLVKLNCPLDSYSIGYSCQEVGIQHSEFQSSLDQTYFANTLDYGNYYELEIVELASRFFLSKLGKSTTGVQHEIEAYARKVERLVSDKERIEKEYKSDRVAEAFRNQYAKAAKISSEKGNLPEAEEFYNLAIQEDPLNSALHDRFAWFMLNRRQNPAKALPLAEKSIELDSDNPDAHLTLALIQYQNQNIPEGDRHIIAAEKLGKPRSLCLLRMGIARYHASKSAKSLEEENQLLNESAEFVQRAEQHLGSSEKYYSRNKQEIAKYTKLSRSALLKAKKKLAEKNTPTKL